jgi:hypothetical protein
VSLRDLLQLHLIEGFPLAPVEKHLVSVQNGSPILNFAVAAIGFRTDGMALFPHL